MSNTRPPIRRVLVLTSSFPRFPGDTSSVFLQYLYREIGRHDYEVHVISPDDVLADGNRLDGINVHRFRYLTKSAQRLAYGSGIIHNLRKHPSYWLQVPFFTISMTIVFLWLVIKLRPAIVHSHWLVPMGFIAGLFRRFSCYRSIVTSHGSDMHTLKGRFFAWMKSYALNHADAWTTNSGTSAAFLMDQHPRVTTQVIPMGVDVALFSSGNRDDTRARFTPGNEFILLYVGRLVRQKGIQDLISAFALLPAEIRRHCRLWIVGDGNFRKQLEHQAMELDIAGQTTFWGNVNQTQLPDYYAAADLFVAPSIVEAGGDVESQGVVYLEAFASGTAVIATDVGGISDTIENNVNGLLINAGNPSELCGAMVKLFSDPALRLRLAKQAKTQVACGYNWRTIGKQFTDLYREILEQEN